MNTHALKSTIRIGRVTAVDPKTARARVQWGQDESCVTNWIRWTTERAGNVKVWNPPSVGEEVEIISPDGDMRNAYIGRSFFNVDNQSPANELEKIVTTYSDGTTITHDLKTNTKTIDGLSLLDHHGNLSVSGNATIKKNTDISGDTNIQGKLTVIGMIKSMTDVFAIAVSLLKHKHIGVVVGKDPSGTPIP